MRAVNLPARIGRPNWRSSELVQGHVHSQLSQSILYPVMSMPPTLCIPAATRHSNRRINGLGFVAGASHTPPSSVRELLSEDEFQETGREEAHSIRSGLPGKLRPTVETPQRIPPVFQEGARLVRNGKNPVNVNPRHGLLAFDPRTIWHRASRQRRFDLVNEAPEFGQFFRPLIAYRLCANADKRHGKVLAIIALAPKAPESQTNIIDNGHFQISQSVLHWSRSQKPALTWTMATLAATRSATMSATRS